jgi:hypothetical protein
MWLCIINDRINSSDEVRPANPGDYSANLWLIVILYL